MEYLASVIVFLAVFGAAAFLEEKTRRRSC